MRVILRDVNSLTARWVREDLGKERKGKERKGKKKLVGLGLPYISLCLVGYEGWAVYHAHICMVQYGAMSLVRDGRSKYIHQQ